MSSLSSFFFIASFEAFFFASALDNMIKFNCGLLTFSITLSSLLLALWLPRLPRRKDGLTPLATLAAFRNWRRCRSFSQNFLRRFSFFHCSLLSRIACLTVSLGRSLRVLLWCFRQFWLLLRCKGGEWCALLFLFCFWSFCASSK